MATPTPPTGNRRDFTMRNADEQRGRNNMVMYVVSSLLLIAVLVILGFWLF